MSQTQENFCSHRRLNRGDAVSIVTQLYGMSPADAIPLASTAHPKSYPPPIGRPLYSTAQLSSLREQVIELATEYGFPNRAVTKSEAFSRFDAELGNLLLRKLQLTPAEAGNEEVWSFLTLILLPDVAIWRFPNKNKNPEFERWIGKPRNVLRKTWLRAYCLGEELNLQLGEDEGVNIMERPTFGLNPQLAKIIARKHVAQPQIDTMSKSDLLRRVMVQLGKISTIVNIDCLNAADQEALVHEIYGETVRSLTSDSTASEL